MPQLTQLAIFPSQNQCLYKISVRVEASLKNKSGSKIHGQPSSTITILTGWRFWQWQWFQQNHWVQRQPEWPGQMLPAKREPSRGDVSFIFSRLIIFSSKIFSSSLFLLNHASVTYVAYLVNGKTQLCRCQKQNCVACDIISHPIYDPCEVISKKNLWNCVACDTVSYT